MEPTKQLSNQRNNQRTNLPTYLPSRERCASLFARLIWPSARPQLVPRFHGRFSQIYAGLRFPRVTFSPPVIPPPPTDSFFSLGLTVCALNLCVLYMHFDSFVRTHVCIHVSTDGRLREKANRPVESKEPMLFERIRKCPSFDCQGSTDLANYSVRGCLFRSGR